MSEQSKGRLLNAANVGVPVFMLGALLYAAVEFGRLKHTVEVLVDIPVRIEAVSSRVAITERFGDRLTSLESQRIRDAETQMSIVKQLARIEALIQQKESGK